MQQPLCQHYIRRKMKHKFLLALPPVIAVFAASGCIRITVTETLQQYADYYQETVQFESESDYADFMDGMNMQAELNGEFVEGIATTVWIYQEDTSSAYRVILSEEQLEDYGDDAIELTITLALCYNSDEGTYDVYSATNWEYPSSWPIISYNSSVRHYFAITWGGDANLLATQNEFAGTLENGDDGDWECYEEDSSAGIIWVTRDSFSELKSTTAHITIEKPEQLSDLTAELRVTYLYSYETSISPKLMEYGLGAPKVAVSGSSDYSRLELCLNGMDY